MKKWIRLLFLAGVLIFGFNASHSSTYAASATGWKYVGGHWYYYTPQGKATGWVSVNHKWYYLNGSGAMQTGWIYSGGKWYFLTNNGDMKTGWLLTGGKWYYLNSTGSMQTGWITVGGKQYYLYADGHMAVNTTVSGKRIGSDGAVAGTSSPAVTIANKSIVEKSNQLDININYPVVSIAGNLGLQTSLNQQFKNEATKIYNDAKGNADQTDLDWGHLKYTVETNKNNILSILFYVEEYSGGAVHGMEWYVPYNIDVRTGKTIKLGDLFTPGTDYLSQIDQYVSDQMDARNLSNDLFNPFTGIQNQNEFYLKDNSLVVYFSEYEFLPYSDFMPQFEMPYSSLKGIHLPN